MGSRKKGFRPHQLHRTLKVIHKTAWSMEHRRREAMREMRSPARLGLLSNPMQRVWP
jgi:hypothetical protein